jgi:hypothetical protein
MHAMISTNTNTRLRTLTAAGMYPDQIMSKRLAPHTKERLQKRDEL